MTLGRHVLPALRWEAGSGVDRVLAEAEAALAHGVGGFILFGGCRDEVAAVTSEVERAAGRPLLFAADLERGAGQQIRGLSESPPPLALAALDDPESIREAAARTASEARSVGINWVLAPVADLDSLPDNPIVQTRSFGSRPEIVARQVAVWIEGCQAAGCLATAKHYPGHGATIHDSHLRTPVVAADAATLAAGDELPFRAAVDAGVGAVMTAHVRYPALDPSGAIATSSPPILDRLRGWGFDGLVVTDAMIMGSVSGSAGEVEHESAVAALAAGVDVVLYPEDVSETIARLTEAEDRGRLTVERLRASFGRYQRALEWIADHPASRSDPTAAAVMADRLLAGGILRGAVASFARPIELVVVDDDLGGPYPPGPSDWVAKALGPDAVGPGHAAQRTRVVLVFSEPRGWKGRARLGPDALAAASAAAEGAALFVLFGHPRLAEQLPAGAPILLAWHRQRLMQEAVARWLRARLA